MTTSTNTLPITETREPASQDELCEVLAEAYRSSTPVYPIGGGTSLDYGLPARREGIGLSLGRLAQIVDYPARDMTVTVEAGVRAADLAAALAAERQQWPVDVPRAAEATVGGIVATNWNGPRRYSLGSVRDSVIGISAVDGTGRLFKGGGRVVKNVAGYDFCKLLTGSMGTLAVISQLTFKLRPVAARSEWLEYSVYDLTTAAAMLDRLVTLQVAPAAVHLLVGSREAMGPFGRDMRSHQLGVLAIGLEGSDREVAWMKQRLAEEFHPAMPTARLDGDAADAWCWIAGFPAESAPLVVKATVVPSGTVPVIETAREIDPDSQIAADAASGVVMIRFPEFPAAGLARTLMGKLNPVAAAHSGGCVIVSNPSGSEMTTRSAWGFDNATWQLMQQIKQRFDPGGILNPGRML